MSFDHSTLLFPKVNNTVIKKILLPYCICYEAVVYTIHMHITVQTTVHAPLATVWDAWTNTAHINGWAFASDDWQADAKTNDVRVGGEFTTIMSAKDGNASFDFSGTYTIVEPYTKLAYTMDDGREVEIVFQETTDGVSVIESFEPETQNPVDMQQSGWQAILDNFKAYTEAL